MKPRWALIGSMAIALGLSTWAHQGHAESTQDLRRQEADTVSQAFLQELGQALMRELTQGGPERAVSVCRELAPAIASKLSRTKGWQIRRVGTRVRNPLLGLADPWEQRGLSQLDERLKQGEEPNTLTLAETVNEPDGRYYRYMRAIVLQPQCVTCHGLPSQIAPGVQRMLMTHYPHDRAKGYQVGDLRGAVSIKQPL